MQDIIYASATALAEAIRVKKVSSVEVVNAHLQRIKTVNPKLNAVVQITADEALAEAGKADAALARGDLKGPLHGVPVTIKDAFETAGVVSTGGTKGRKSFVPAQDATAVARLRSAGAVIIGKTNVPELSLVYESDNLIYGRTNNPHDLSRTPGGSSGGEAVVIAAGGSPLGLGSDAAGSIRIPAHFCGIAGIKPTPGLVPTSGHFPPAVWVLERISSVGLMAGTVADLILGLPIIAGMDGYDPATVPVPLGAPGAINLKQLRVAYYTDNGIVPPTTETAQAVSAAVEALSGTVLSVREDRPDGIELSYDIMNSLLAADGGAGLQTLLQMAQTNEPHPLTQRLLEQMRPRALSTAEFGGLMVRWYMLRNMMLSFFADYDVIICPVCAGPAMAHGTTLDDDQLAAFSYAVTYNLNGWPGVTVPTGTTPGGLPIGVQVVARPWREDVALAVALHIESSLGGRQRPPI